MPKLHRTHPAAIALPVLLLLAAQAWSPAARAEETVDLGTRRPSVTDIQNGLFPDDACEELKANGFKCMGFKPAVRFSLPAASFGLGSAELTSGIRRQLDVFAQALKGKSGGSRTIRIEGHADASGSAEGNLVLSQRRADAARDYRVAQGVQADLLKPIGLGSADLIDQAHPRDARNRRVVIGRDQQPEAPAGPAHD